MFDYRSIAITGISNSLTHQLEMAKYMNLHIYNKADWNDIERLSVGSKDRWGGDFVMTDFPFYQNLKFLSIRVPYVSNRLLKSLDEVLMLEDLVIETMEMENVIVYPRLKNLRKFIIHAQGTSLEVNLQRLPVLEGFYCDKGVVSGIPHRIMKSLSLDTEIEFDRSLLNYNVYPRLENLDVSDEKLKLYPFIRQSCPNLKSLKIFFGFRGYGRTAHIPFSIKKHVPASVKVLKLYMNIPDYLDFSGLKQLDYLEFEGMGEINLSSYKWPRNLTSLHFRRTELVGRLRIGSKVLSKLEYLSIYDTGEEGMEGDEFELKIGPGNALRSIILYNVDNLQTREFGSYNLNKLEVLIDRFSYEDFRQTEDFRGLTMETSGQDEETRDLISAEYRLTRGSTESLLFYDCSIKEIEDTDESDDDMSD